VTFPGKVERVVVDLLKPDVLVWAAMRRATEIGRTTPASGAELETLVDWARAHAAAGDGRCSVLFEVVDSGGRAARGDAPPAGDGYPLFRAALRLVRRLWEADADPAHGRWIFMRLETTATRFTIERRYDTWPHWMPQEPRLGPAPGALRREMARRSPAYRPGWSLLLGPRLMPEHQHL
jgi:hypothetical protein